MEKLKPEYDIPEFVKKFVNAYMEFRNMDRVDAVYWVKNTFCKQFSWKLTNEEWAEVIGMKQNERLD